MRTTQQLNRHRAAKRKPEEQNSFLERKEQRTSAPHAAPPPSSRAQRGDPTLLGDTIEKRLSVVDNQETIRANQKF
ncbi:hypothetical protein [Acidiphilium sp. MT5]